MSLHKSGRDATAYDALFGSIYAGANAVQLCSVLYDKGVEHLEKIRKDMEDWMKAHDVASLQSIRGKLSLEESDNPELYSRLQYIKALVGIE